MQGRGKMASGTVLKQSPTEVFKFGNQAHSMLAEAASVPPFQRLRQISQASDVASIPIARWTKQIK